LPATADAVRLPPALGLSTPPAGPLLMASVTLPVKVGSMFPAGVKAAITRLKPLEAPTLVGGWVRNTNCVAVAATTLNALVVTLGRPPEEATSLYPVPALLTVRLFGNVATPALACTLTVPPRTVPAPPALFPIDRETTPEKVG